MCSVNERICPGGHGRTLDRLRSQIRDRETARAGHFVVDLGWAQTGPDGKPDLLSAGAIHEWMLGCVGASYISPITILSGIARLTLRAAPERAAAVWIGEGCLNAAQAAFTELQQTLWVHAASPYERLWAADLALRCAAVAVVVIDAQGFDMAATRRLQLAAEAGGTLGLLSRPTADLKSLSAANTRWLVTPVPSPSLHPRWSVELLRCKGLQSMSDAPHRWVVECNDAQSALSVPAEPAGRPLPASAASARHRLGIADAG